MEQTFHLIMEQTFKLYILCFIHDHMLSNFDTLIIYKYCKSILNLPKHKSLVGKTIFKIARCGKQEPQSTCLHTKHLHGRSISSRQVLKI